MNNIHEMPLRLDPIDEASEWLARLDRGLADHEEQALQGWLASDPDNPAALMEVAKLWDKMDALSRLADLFPQQAKQPPKPTQFALPLAAAVMLAVLLGLWVAPGFYQEAGHEQSLAGVGDEQVFQTAVGEHSTVNLPDGSQLILNTNSRIRATFTRQQRLLVLERGEVYVQVAHDQTRPLKVYTGNTVVEAVGTAFNLQITEDQRIELIVTEGKVLVGVADKRSELPSKPDIKSVVQEPAVPVAAGEQMLLGDADEEVKRLEPEDIEVKLSWRGGNLVFRGESLAEALTQIERYTPVEFVILDEDLKKIRIVGLFKAGDVEGLLATLRENFNVAYQRVDDKKVILTNTSTEM